MARTSPAVRREERDVLPVAEWVLVSFGGVSESGPAHHPHMGESLLAGNHKPHTPIHRRGSMPGYELVFISMSRGYGWHCLIGGEYSTAGNPPKTVSQARQEGVEHVRQVHGVRNPQWEERMRVASHAELFEARAFG